MRDVDVSFVSFKKIIVNIHFLYQLSVLLHVITYRLVRIAFLSYPLSLTIHIKLLISDTVQYIIETWSTDLDRTRKSYSANYFFFFTLNDVASASQKYVIRECVCRSQSL